MKFFITSETTADVTHDELSVLRAFEDRLNWIASNLQIDSVELVAIVLVIMNPEIAPPFPAGVILRRTRKELDIRPAVDFASWKAVDRRGRVELIIEAVSDALRGQRKKGLSDHSISAIEAALQHGYRGSDLI